MAEFFDPNLMAFVESNTGLFLTLLVWSLIWKGIALWKSARLSHKWWFVIILIVNTIGILDIIYIFLVARKYKVESKEVK